MSFDKGDGQGLVHLAPDQRITAVPYALVKQGAIPADDSAVLHHHRPTERANPQVLEARDYPRPTSPRFDLRRANRSPCYSQSQGKFLTYQWRKNGQPIAGAIEDRYVIQSANASQHEGNYTLVVSNDFGSVTTQATEPRGGRHPDQSHRCIDQHGHDLLPARAPLRWEVRRANRAGKRRRRDPTPGHLDQRVLPGQVRGDAGPVRGP